MFPRPRRIETELSRDVLNPARVTLSWANSPTLGTYSSPRMRRADIEVPNLAVDVNSWARSACYPRGSFYPLSHTPSTRKCGITKPDFRPCSARPPRSQAPFCLCTLCGWCPFTLREPLGASVTLWEATAPVKLPAWPCLPSGSRKGHETQKCARVVFHWRLPALHRKRFSGSHLCYACTPSSPDQGVVKLHGVFLSCRGKPVSSRVLQFRRAPCRDSAQVVTPFVRVGTYPTRNFATLGPL